MTPENVQQGWRLAAVGTLGLVLLLGGLGVLMAFMPAPRRAAQTGRIHRARAAMSLEESGPNKPTAEPERVGEELPAKAKLE